MSRGVSADALVVVDQRTWARSRRPVEVIRSTVGLNLTAALLLAQAAVRALGHSYGGAGGGWSTSPRPRRLPARPVSTGSKRRPRRGLTR